MQKKKKKDQPATLKQFELLRYYLLLRKKDYKAKKKIPFVLYGHDLKSGMTSPV